GECGVPLAVRRGDGESPAAFGFPRRSRSGSGCAVHAGDRVVGGPGTGVGKSSQSGRSAGASERGSGEFSAGRALAEIVGGVEAACRGVAGAVGESGIIGGAVVAAKGGAAARGRGEAGATGTGDRAVAGVETEAGGNGEAGGTGKVRTKDSRQRAAGEHERC